MAEADSPQSLRARIPSRPVRALLAAWMLLGTGGWAFTTALSVFAFDRSGATAVGAVAAARLLPAMVAAPFTGGLIDRGDRGRIVAMACALEAACAALVAALVIGGGSLAVIVALAALGSVAATATRPGLEALLPALAQTPAELTVATAAWSAVDNAGFLLGAGAGGTAIAGVGAGAILVVAAVIEASAGLLSLSLPRVTATAPDEPDAVDEEGFAGALAGLRALRGAPLLRVPFALFAGLLVLEGTTDVQLVALALGKLRMGNGGPGVLFAVWGVGGLLGSVVILALVRRRGYGLALLVGAVGFGAALAVTGLDGVALAVAAMVPAGLGFALVETGMMALVPRLADDAVVGRVYALSELAYAGAGGLGALIAPLLIDALGIAGSITAVGVIYGALALLSWRRCERLDDAQEQAGGLRDLLRGVPFLTPLPLPRLERLVRDAHPVTVPAGTAVVTAGEPGAEFFVIQDGTVQIAETGREQGPGTGFGEIALLRDVPRTATVRAASDVRLWSVSRSSFVAAVTGHGDATRLADAVVTEHLARDAAPAGSALLS